MSVRGFLVYALGMGYLLVFQLPLLLITPFLPRAAHNLQARCFAGLSLWLLRHLCGLSYKVYGYENMPPQACIIASNHQSAWETVFFAYAKRLTVSVMKRELLWIPVYGLSVMLHGHIFINRGRKATAMRKVMRQGKQRLHSGMDILIFPEGTRISGEGMGRFSRSAAHLALIADSPIIPVAHNAGLYWPRHSIGKYPGEIVLRYGKPIYPEGRSQGELTALVRKRIVELLATLPNEYKAP